jgi:metal-responsive CopG/Arc/MetJ family transcriptional regulator
VPKRRKDTARTTVTLPRALLDAADREVRRGAAATRNALIARALRHELAAARRKEIDAAYAQLADDREATAESLQVAEEFARADWEALREGEL